MRAFDFFGGVPIRISYDNSKVAVSKVISHRERKLTAEFLRLKSHFLYEEHFGILRRRFEAEVSGRGTREFIKVLRLLESHSLSALKDAVQHALEIGAASADAVRLILEYREEQPVDLFCLEGRPHLKSVQIRQTSVLAYQSLLSSSGVVS